MNTEHIIIYVEKSVVLFLKNNFVYTCKILSVKEDSTLIRDKFGKLVSVNNDLIEKIEEIQDDGRG